MLTELQILIVFALAIVGAVFSALLGWLESGEDFIPRKFIPSVMRAIVAGIVFALGFGLSELAITNTGDLILIYFEVFVGGAGIDVLGHRVAKTLESKPV